MRQNWHRASAAKGDPDAVLRSDRIYILFPLIVVEVFFALAFLYLVAVSWRTSIIAWATSLLVLAAALAIGCYKFKSFEERPGPSRGSGSTHSHLIRKRGRIGNDRELKVTLERITKFQDQISALRVSETDPVNYRAAISGFLAEIDRMQLEVHEYLSSHPAERAVDNA